MGPNEVEGGSSSFSPAVGANGGIHYLDVRNHHPWSSEARQHESPCFLRGSQALSRQHTTPTNNLHHLNNKNTYTQALQVEHIFQKLFLAETMQLHYFIPLYLFGSWFMYSLLIHSTCRRTYNLCGFLPMFRYRQPAQASGRRQWL